MALPFISFSAGALTIGPGIAAPAGAAVSSNTIQPATAGAALTLRTSANANILLNPNGTGGILANSASNAMAGANSTIAGGTLNAVAGGQTFIGGGSGNAALSQYSAVVGGQGNQIDGLSQFAAILSGQGNAVSGGETAVICGGASNVVDGANGFIGGGETNYVDIGSIDCGVCSGAVVSVYGPSAFSWLGGGVSQAIINGQACAIAGGNGNIVGSFDDQARATSNAAIAGGINNAIGAGADGATIGGGQNNSVSAAGVNAAIPGGSGNAANAAGAFAAGVGATAATANSFVWNDGSAAGHTSANANQFLVHASGVGGGNSVTFFSNAGATTGATLANAASAWAAVSDRNAKENIVLLDPADVLRRVEALPVYAYNYKTADPAVVNRGPVAQEWHALFPSRKDPLRIDTMDLDGVSLAAIKGLASLVRAQAAALEAQAAASAVQAAAIVALRAELAALCAALAPDD